MIPTGEETDETRPLDATWRQAAHEQHVPCAVAGCTGDVTHVRRWRTAAMPGAAYDYLCTAHATAQQQEVSTLDFPTQGEKERE